MNNLGVRSLARYTLLLLLCGVLFHGLAHGVLTQKENGSNRSIAPRDDPGWAHVGVANGLTAIYLGQGWIISAAHVGEGQVSIGGITDPPLPGSRVILIYSELESRQSDLALFRIDPFPAELPTLPIRSLPVSIGTHVLMIGHGFERGEPISVFRPASIRDGYQWSTVKRLTWGRNEISGTRLEIRLGSKTTRSFKTNFSRHGLRNEGQATNGDSGGPIFIKNEGTWELAGVMFGVAGLPKQGANTSIYGDVTYSSDLSYYREQILEIVTPRCGNGYLTPDEECDEAGAGACCTSSCTFEPESEECPSLATRDPAQPDRPSE